MADKDKKENAPIASPSKLAATSTSLQDRLTSATLFTPAGFFNAIYGSQVRGSVRDFAVNIVDTVGTVVTFNPESGDKAADWLKDKWDKAFAHVDGKFDFRMAKGWKVPEGVRYNGKLPTDAGYEGPAPGKEINPFLSIFYRDKKGNIEVLDSKDARFTNIVGPYAITQAALMATVGTKGVTSLKSSLSLSQGFAAKAGTTAYLGLASADLWGGGMQIAETFRHSMILKPEAIDRFAHIIDKAESLTPAQMQKDLNLILEQYAKKSGRNTAQYYIPALATSSGAIDLLDQMSKGQVKGFVRVHPFADISEGATKENIHIGNIREIAENPYFQRSFFKLAIKSIEGNTLNQSERMALRFGMNILFAQKDLPLSAANNQAELDLHANALKSLRGYIAEPLITDKFRKFFEEDKSLTSEQVDARIDYAMLSWVKSGRQSLPPDKELVHFLTKQSFEVNANIEAKEQLEMQQIQAQAMAFSMH